jgi:hypothetical protein
VRATPLLWPTLTLHFSQLLNVLTTVMLYAAARVLFASRRAGLLAAAGVGVVSWFPAYFLSWGRYTQMTGVLLAVPALLLLWRLRGQVRPGGLIAATLLVAGLALVHVRVAFLAAILAGVLGGVLLFQRRGRTLLWWLAAAGGALLITLPWWLWLAQSAAAQALVAVRTDGGAGWDNYNLPDWGLVWAPRNPLLVAVPAWAPVRCSAGRQSICGCRWPAPSGWRCWLAWGHGHGGARRCARSRCAHGSPGCCWWFGWRSRLWCCKRIASGCRSCSSFMSMSV